MSIQETINEAADMMAAFDKGAANIFRNQPFHRAMIVESFRKGFLTHSANSLAACDLLDKVVSLDIKFRQLEAREQR
jgi:hypothetical protein